MRCSNCWMKPSSTSPNQSIVSGIINASLALLCVCVCVCVLVSLCILNLLPHQLMSSWQLPCFLHPSGPTRHILLPLFLLQHGLCVVSYPTLYDLYLPGMYPESSISEDEINVYPIISPIHRVVPGACVCVVCCDLASLSVVCQWVSLVASSCVSKCLYDAQQQFFLGFCPDVCMTSCKPVKPDKSETLEHAKNREK